jgi:hypothetical protein
MKTTSLFSALAITTALGVASAACAQAQEAYITPQQDTRFANSAPIVLTDGVSSTRARPLQGEPLANLVHEYQVAIKATNRQIKLVTSDEEREALKARKAELEHDMIALQQSNG